MAGRGRARTPATRRRARRSPAWRSAPAPPPTTSRCSRCRWRSCGGRRPVFSLNPVPGALDAMVSSELLETARQIGNGMSVARAHAGHHLVAPQPDHAGAHAAGRRPRRQRRPAQGRAPPSAASTMCSTWRAWRSEAGTVVSAVMLGAIAGSGLLPFAARALRERGARRRRPRGRGQPARLRARRSSAVQRGTGLAEQVAGRSGADARLARIDTGATGEPRHSPRPCRRALCRRVPAGGARHAGPRPRPHARVPGPRPTPSSTCERLRARAAGRARSRSAGGARLRHDARDGALAGAVDGVRRHRARGRPEEPRAAAGSACSGEVKARRRRPAASVYDHFKPGAARIRGAAAAAAWRSACCAGTARACCAGKTPWALPLKIAHALGRRHARAARAGRPEVAARARQPLRATSRR